MVSPSLFSGGMFSDGLQYAAISHNLAKGIGTFWNPHLSNSLYPQFHEHPPFVFFLQSLWFRLFGDSIYIERFYSLFTLIFTGIIVVSIWKTLTGNIKTSWIPLFFLVIIPKISWSVSNNMLENTMMVFTSLSALFYLKSLSKRRFLFLLLSAVSLFFAMFSKGFVALYIWSFPLWIFLFTKKIALKQTVSDTVLIIFFTLLPLFLIMVLSPEANRSLTAYFNRQIIGSFKNIQTVTNRFTILWDFVSGIALPVVIALIVKMIAHIKNIRVSHNKFTSMALAFFALSFSGVLPIAISLKQSSFYILTVYPFFVISLSLIAEPYISQLINLSKIRRINGKFVYLFFLFSLIFSYFQIYQRGRDKAKRDDIKKIISYVGENTDLSIKPELFADWSLHGYFVRYANVSLDPNNKNHRFFIDKTKISDTLFLKRYEYVPLKTATLFLYKRKE